MEMKRTSMNIRVTELPACCGAGCWLSDPSCTELSVRVGSVGCPGVGRDAPRAALGLSDRVVLHRGSETSDVFCVSFSSISKEDLPWHLYFVHLQKGFAFLTLFSWAQREMCTHLLFATCLVFRFAPGCVFSL